MDRGASLCLGGSAVLNAPMSHEPVGARSTERKDEPGHLSRLPLGGHAGFQGQPVYRRPGFPRNPRASYWLARIAYHRLACNRG
jgi:hypothetical protein